MNRLGEVIQNSYSQFFILLIASIQSLRSPNAVKRIYPSPLGPKPTPGVPTTLASYNICSKNRHDESPFGVSPISRER